MAISGQHIDMLRMVMMVVVVVVWDCVSASSVITHTHTHLQDPHSSRLEGVKKNPSQHCLFVAQD